TCTGWRRRRAPTDAVGGPPRRPSTGRPAWGDGGPGAGSGRKDHMTLLRLIARPMLAAVFISSGVKHIRNPEPHVAVAKPVTDRIMPAVKKFTPPQLVDQIPDDAATLVRINGAIQVAGGVALATG